MTSELSNFAARLRERLRNAEPGARNAERPGHQTAARDFSETDFNQLALELFALQFARNPVYRRVCEACRLLPEAVKHWRGIPTLPTPAFKEFDVTCLPPAERTHVFHSSGTTEQRPSRHFHCAESLAVYEASLWPWFARHVVPDFKSQISVASSRPRSSGRESAPFSEKLERTHVRCYSVQRGSSDFKLIILTPPAVEAAHSSLVHMFETVRRKLLAPDTAFCGSVAHDGSCEASTVLQPRNSAINPPSLGGRVGPSAPRPGFVRTARWDRRALPPASWELDLPRMLARLREAVECGVPLVLLGTAFSFVHLLDFLAKQHLRIELPPGSRVMETGGYKGRSRSLPKAELHALITDRLAIPASHIVCEYGMSELSSQAYDAALDATRNTQHATRTFRFPPWARAQIISPETGHEVAEGETGLLRVFDLANVWSVLAIQTEDLGVRRGDGFELLGRAARAEPRGCSLMAV
jgi:hypothetical protein